MESSYFTFTESNIKIVKMEHKGMFLSPNTQLVCIVDLVKKPFNGNFQWYLNGSPIEGKSKDVDFGWWISKTEPKVYYDFIVKDPGNYTCAVTDKGQHWNATARVVKFQGK